MAHLARSGVHQMSLVTSWVQVVRRLSQSAGSARRVVVTGMGVVTPLGVGVEHFWGRLLDAHSGIVKLTDPGFQGLPSRVAAVVPRGKKDGELDDEAYIADKEHRQLYKHFALVAAAEALEQAGWQPSSEQQQCRTGVAIGSAMPLNEKIFIEARLFKANKDNYLPADYLMNSLCNKPAELVSLEYGFKGPLHCVSTACATGAHSIGDAAQFIRNDYADVMVSGSTETCLCPLVVAGFARIRALSTHFNDSPQQASRPFDRDRDGFIIGEGAGVLVLEELNHAVQRGATIIAELIGYGLSGDASHITSPSADGDGMYRSMLSAVSRAGISASDIGYVNAHATSTPLGDAAETLAITRLFGEHCDRLAVSSTKSAIGHLLAAAGSVEAVVSILACRDGCIPPTLNCDHPIEGSRLNYVPHKAVQWDSQSARRVALSNSFGFGGTNASLCFRQWIDDENYAN